MMLRGISLATILSIPVLAGDADSGNHQVTFTKDVAPIFQRACQSCHHAGTSAPMPLMTYKEARPWARSIKERVARRDMPPWHLDKTVGVREYKNDRSLTDQEIATIVRWADNGTPEGDPRDLPAPLTFKPENEWFIGTPDLTVTSLAELAAAAFHE